MGPREAIKQLACNHLVTAGAGAGKTTCLVQTYLALLCGEWSGEPLMPGQIAAITYTDKAAAEMRSKVVSRAAGLAASGAALAGWDQLLPRIEWAPMGTIHSFCAELLREFGPSLGLDPDFTVLDENQFSLVLQEVVDDVLRRELARGRQKGRQKGRQNGPEHSPLRGLLAHYALGGQRGVRGLLIWLHGSLATHGLSPEQAREATADAHAQRMAQGQGIVTRMGRVVAELDDALAGGLPINRNAGYGKNILTLLAEWSDLQKGLAARPLDGAALTRVSELIKGNWYAAKSFKRELEEHLKALAEQAALGPSAELSDGLLALAEMVNARLERRLAALGGLSFDHLLNLANRLLESDHRVLAELRGRFKVLMVDEFQDVNPVQGRLIRLLAGLDDPDGYAPPDDAIAPRLLLVGDRKQSIYAFRGADVGVFQRTMRQFIDGHWPGELLALKRNFRSHPELIGFFNRLFAQIFAGPGQAELDHQVEFLPQDEQAAGTEPDGPARVEVLRVEGPEEKAPAAYWRELEAGALAAHLAGLRDQGVPLGDMAILFRRLTQVGAYEQALARAGLGSYTLGGRDFYARQEIGDILSALRALLHPGDEAALAGFLRSPLVGLSDETILGLAYDGPQRRGLARAVRQRVSAPEYASPLQAAAWQKGLRLITRLAPLARRMTPAELLGELVSATDLMAVLSAASQGPQQIANLKKLIETARQGALGSSVEGFAQGLGAMLEEQPKENQAPLMGENAQVVRLMTIHQAKGLEFPVVALPDLDAPLLGGGGGQPGPDAKGVISLDSWDPTQGRKLKSAIYNELAQRKRDSEQAEAARLFYVACTRAEKRLIFCLTGHKKRGLWAKWVQDHVLPDELAQEVTPPDGPPEHAWDTGQDAAPLPSGPGTRAEEGADLAARCLHPRPRLAGGLMVRESVSGLEDWLACPRRYYHTRVLGLDTAALPLAGQASGDGASNPAELGSRVHKLLELADLTAGPESLDQARQQMGLSHDDAQEALGIAAGFWRTGLADLASACGPDAMQREMPFRLHLGGEDGGPGLEVMGEMDLVLATPEGFLVADYKVTPKIEPAKYRTQLAIYALALWRGQGGGIKDGGPVPRTALCYLSPGAASLKELEISPAELEELAARLKQAAAQMALIGPHTSLADLAPGPECSAKCALARAGLCAPPDGGPHGG